MPKFAYWTRDGWNKSGNRGIAVVVESNPLHEYVLRRLITADPAGHGRSLRGGEVAELAGLGFPEAEHDPVLGE